MYDPLGSRAYSETHLSIRCIRINIAKRLPVRIIYNHPFRTLRSIRKKFCHEYSHWLFAFVSFVFLSTSVAKQERAKVEFLTNIQKHNKPKVYQLLSISSLYILFRSFGKQTISL